MTEVSMARNYWMVISNLENFNITREHKFTAQGLKFQRQRKVQRVEPGDRILYYISGVRYFGATATVTSRYSEDQSPLWKREGMSDWAFKVQIKPEIVLNDDEFMDACQIAPRLDYVRKWTPEDWYMAFAMSNLHLLPKKDFTLVEEEMRKVKKHGARPSPRPFAELAHPTG
jgi:hypothetical protein